jgi:hypothetical protein
MRDQGLTAGDNAAASGWAAALHRLGYDGACTHLLRQVLTCPERRVRDIGTGAGDLARAIWRGPVCRPLALWTRWCRLMQHPGCWR